MKKKLLIFIITYEAGHRVLEVFKKIPFKNLKKYNVSILISDDCSKDSTVNFAKKIKYKKIYINKNHKNLGYGGNIKFCIKYALKKNIDYAVMIHGDDQYDAKYVPALVKKLKSKNTDIVTGSRMLNKHTAMKGGMPIYKFIGNIILTKIFNTLCNTNFTDAHTGLWAYNLNIFKYINLKKMDNGYNFDNQIRITAVNNNLKIKEISINTFYRTETSRWHIIYSLNFLKYLLFNFFGK